MIKKPSIEKVKEKYEMEWMKLQGIEGVGITEVEGEKVIVLYCSKQIEEIPSNVESFRVIQKLTNEFKAL